MRRLVIFLIVLTVGVFIALVAREDPGYVRIAFMGYIIESSVMVLIGLLIITFGVAYYLVRAMSATRRMPRHIRQWSSQRRLTKAHESLTRGMLDLAEGRWRDAEHLLTRHANNSEIPLLNYLGAAQAAQRQGAITRADGYLKQAKRRGRKADTAVDLAATELLLQRGELEEALNTLRRLYSAAPKHPKVIALLMQTYLDLRDWEHLIELLPAVRRHHVVPDDETRRLEITAWTELMAGAAQKKNGKFVHEVWERIPRALHSNETLVYAYASQLIACGEDVDAMQILRKVLNKNWSDALIYLYGIADGGTNYLPQQLHSAEEWLHDRTKNPVLLLTLGRLALRNGMADKARNYLEASVAAGAQPETYRDLGALLEKLGDSDRALACYQKGLSLMTNNQQRPGPLLPGIKEKGVSQASLLIAQ